MNKMNQLELRRADDWMQLINTKTGEIIVEGHRLDPEDILTALGYDFFVTYKEEV